MTDEKRALIVDDEPEFLTWVEDFLEGRGLRVVYAKDLPEAEQVLADAPVRFVVVLIDMNIPAPSGIPNDIRADSPLATKYPGLVLAARCRNLGYGAHSVVAYTVHDDDAIEAELQKVHSRYVLKGRPEVLKRVLTSSLEPHPPR